MERDNYDGIVDTEEMRQVDEDEGSEGLRDMFDRKPDHSTGDREYKTKDELIDSLQRELDQSTDVDREEPSEDVIFRALEIRIDRDGVDNSDMRHNFVNVTDLSVVDISGNVIHSLGDSTDNQMDYLRITHDNGQSVETYKSFKVNSWGAER